MERLFAEIGRSLLGSVSLLLCGSSSRKPTNRMVDRRPGDVVDEPGAEVTREGYEEFTGASSGHMPGGDGRKHHRKHRHRDKGDKGEDARPKDKGRSGARGYCPVPSRLKWPTCMLTITGQPVIKDEIDMHVGHLNDKDIAPISSEKSRTRDKERSKERRSHRESSKERTKTDKNRKKASEGRSKATSGAEEKSKTDDGRDRRKEKRHRERASPT